MLQKDSCNLIEKPLDLALMGLGAGLTPVAKTLALQFHR